MNYINIDKKRLCGRNNNVVPPLIIDYSTIENVEFTFINSQNQIIPVEDGLSGFYMAGSVKMGEPSCELLFLSKDFQIVDGKLVFNIDTYTQPYLRQIKKKNTEINIEIGQISLESKKIWLRDYALANPRVYVAGLSPQEIESNDYYTKEETNELVDIAKAYADTVAANALSSAQDYADAEDAVTLASANAYTDEQIEHLEISGYVTDEELESAKAELEGDIALKAAESDLQLVSGEVDSLAQDIIGKADKADVDIISGTVDGHIADSTIHVTAADKTAWNGKLDPSALEGYATEQYVNGQVSGKADQSALTAHTSDAEIHTTALEKAAWNAKQNAITADNKLDYALLSGVPEDNPALVPIEVKTTTEDCIYEVDFTGKAIQKYDLASATGGSNSLEILFTNLANVPNGVAPTIELQIPVTEADVSTISLPTGTQVIDMPDSLTSTSGKISYADIVFRAEKDVNDTIKVYCNYSYNFDEEEEV